MPFILFDPSKSVRNLQRSFAAETGLFLQVYSGGGIAGNTTRLFDLQRKNYSNEWICQQLKYPRTDYYLLDLRAHVCDFEEIVRYLYNLEIRLYSRDFRIPGKKECMKDLVSDGHCAKKSYPEKLVQLSQRYRLVENDIFVRLGTMNDRISGMIAVENFFADFNVYASVSYYLRGKRFNNPEIHTHEIFGMYHGERGDANRTILFPFRKDGSSLLVDHLRYDLGLTDYDILRIHGYSIEIHSECQRLMLKYP